MAEHLGVGQSATKQEKQVWQLRMQRLRRLFCGVPEMTSRVDFSVHSGVWANANWVGPMHVNRFFVKDVPNAMLRDIRNTANEHKSVTNSRDCTEILPFSSGQQVMGVMGQYNSSKSLKMRAH